MLHRNLIGQRLLALFLLGWLLFNFPLLALFAGASDWLGVPAVWLYLFAAWLLLIVLMACVAERTQERPSRQAWAGEDFQSGAGGVPVAPDTRE
ncbi:hypothetical protein [Janthinobacterium sp. 17J80-10]|uniref:hypothetical protein n=1 Tax=Janthinobacterium sp. 17J80-10 TaxID=2497863 RepID=UPI0019D714AE|nr:hypothetical protein [Janthinobacterium sp. 17J80-10]